MELAELSLSADRRSRGEYHTFADIAAMRLACYGIVDKGYLEPADDIDEALTRPEVVRLLYNTFAQKGEYSASPFTDIDEAYRDCIDWAYQSGIAQGIDAVTFGTGEISEVEFVTLLLRALGFGGQFAWNEAVAYAEKCGLSPVGLSDGFTRGDAMLYLQDAILLYDIPHEVISETPFPRYIDVYPQTVEEIEGYLREAVMYLADRVFVRMSDSFGEEELAAAFALYDDYRAQYETKDYREDLWFYPVLYGNITSFRVMQRDDYVAISFVYSNGWDLTRDYEDDAFTHFSESAVVTYADEVYRKYHERVPQGATDKQKVQIAMQFICDTADYDWGEYGAIVRGDYNYHVDAHSVLGYLKDGRIVCDGYSDTLRYLMAREGIPCITVDGAETADEKWATHSWNKVKIDGQWLNVDVCWKDTTRTSRYDFKTDAQYTKLKHFPYIFGGGVFCGEYNNAELWQSSALLIYEKRHFDHSTILFM